MGGGRGREADLQQSAIFVSFSFCPNFFSKNFGTQMSIDTIVCLVSFFKLCAQSPNDHSVPPLWRPLHHPSNNTISGLIYSSSLLFLSPFLSSLLLLFCHLIKSLIRLADQIAHSAYPSTSHPEPIPSPIHSLSASIRQISSPPPPHIGAICAN